jgi:hypothetical protein
VANSGTRKRFLRVSPATAMWRPREDVNQTRMVASLGQDLPDAVLLPESLRPLDVLDLDPFLGSNALCLSAYGFAERLRELHEVVEHPDVSTVEHRRRRPRMTGRAPKKLDHLI